MTSKTRVFAAFLMVVLSAAGVMAAEPDHARYAGTANCSGCHQAQADAWSRSHHAHAMQQASEKTVLGDFADRRFEYAGRSSRFYRDGDAFMVTTEGADGKDHDFRVEYTFGYFPLQQYLIRLEQGRIHALSIAWDARPEADGGQRWIHLYPDEQIDAADPLHWTGPYQQWNSRCADCHSTGLERGFDPKSLSFDTRWAEINVGCEACHGPGKAHVEAVRTGQIKPLPIDPGKRGQWAFAAGESIAHRVGETTVEKQLAVCGPCHSRRTNYADVGKAPAFEDAHLPALLEPGLYQPDGQILDEVFVYGSFTQSRMYQRGVTCSDCHDPHSQQLHAEGNGVCAQCHLPSKYDQVSHHHHEDGTPGAQCAACHMPQRTYMVVDPRRDHSFRVPDPWLSKQAGVNNTCTDCHADRDADWAIHRLGEWGVKSRQPTPASLLAHGLGSDTHAMLSLRQLIADTSAPPMQRASALALMQPGSEQDLDLLAAALQDQHALVRLGAVRALAAVAPDYSRAMLWPMLKDPAKTVRLEAVRQLAGIPDNELSEAQRAERAAVIEEYVQAQRASDGLAAGPMNLAALYVAQGRAADAEQAYRQAIRIEPSLVPAWLNLADLQRATGRDDAAAASLQQALAIAPESAAAHHAWGLHLVRQQRTAEAMGELKTAVELEPANPRYAYVYAVALNSTGNSAAAIALIEQRHKAGAIDMGMLQLLLSLYQQSGDVEGVQRTIGEIRRIDKAARGSQ